MDAVSVASPCKRHGLPRRLYYDLTARPRSSWRVDKVLIALLWGSHGVPTTLLFRTPSDGVCFEHVCIFLERQENGMTAV